MISFFRFHCFNQYRNNIGEICMDMEVLYYIECRKKRRRRRRDTFDITNFCREEKNKQSEQKCKQVYPSNVFCGGFELMLNFAITYKLLKFFAFKRLYEFRIE